jgi:hypothetical protein
LGAAAARIYGGRAQALRPFYLPAWPFAPAPRRDLYAGGKADHAIGPQHLGMRRTRSRRSPRLFLDGRGANWGTPCQYSGAPGAVFGPGADCNRARLWISPSDLGKAWPWKHAPDENALFIIL